MIKKAAVDAGQDFIRNFLIQLVPPVIIAIPVGVVAVHATLIYGMIAAMDSFGWVLLTAGVCWPAFLLAAIAVWIGLTGIGALVWNQQAVERETRSVGAACASTGMKLSGVNTEGRRYYGVVNLKPVSLYVYPGPTIDLHVQSPLPAFVSVVEKDAVLRSVASVLAQKQPEALGISELSRYDIYASDTMWAQAVLSDRRTRAIVLRLMDRPDATESRQVRFETSGVTLKLDRTRPQDVTPDRLRQWLADLLALIEIAGSMPGPETHTPAVPFKSDGEISARAQMVPFLAMSASLGLLSAVSTGIVGCNLVYVCIVSIVLVLIGSIFS
jgi:hypothetical protein